MLKKVAKEVVETCTSCNGTGKHVVTKMIATVDKDKVIAQLNEFVSNVHKKYHKSRITVFLKDVLIALDIEILFTPYEKVDFTPSIRIMNQASKEAKVLFKLFEGELEEIISNALGEESLTDEYYPSFLRKNKDFNKFLKFACALETLFEELRDTRYEIGLNRLSSPSKEIKWNNLSINDIDLKNPVVKKLLTLPEELKSEKYEGH